MRFDLLRRYPDFRNLFYGQAVSQIGDALYYVAFMFMVKKLTGRDDMVGFVGALEVLPFLLLSAHAGVLADRLDRRKILLITDYISAGILFLVLGIAVLNGTPPVWTLFLAATTLSTVRAFFFPARTASIPRLVPPEKVGEAFALALGIQNLMMFGGTMLTAGVLSALYDRSPMLFFVTIMGLNGTSFLLSAYFLNKLPPILPQRDETPVELAEGEKPKSEVREGISFVKNRPDLKTLMFSAMFFCLGVSPFFVTYVAANDQWFGGKPATLALCEGAFFVGMIVSTYLVGRLKPKRVGWGVFWAMLVVAGGVALMAFSRNFWLFCLWNVVCGLAVPFSDIPVRTYIQLTVPDAFRGRVNALHNMLATSMMPVGMATAGILIKSIGLVNAFLSMGALMAASCGIVLAGKEFREARLPSWSGDDEGSTPTGTPALEGA